MVRNAVIKTTAAANTVLVEAHVVPHEIGFLNSLVEEYEGMALMRTLDRKTGHVKFWVPGPYLPLLVQVFDDFIQQGWMESYEIIDPWWEIRSASD